MLSRVSLVLLLGLVALVSARYSSEEFGGRREDRRGAARPWYWRRFSGRHGHGGPGAPWFPPHGGPHGGPHGPHRRGPPFPPPPFLKYASEEARKEFFQIFENSNQTKAQTKERIMEWSSKQPQEVQDHVGYFERNMTLARSFMKENATAVILQLETALDRFTTILEDESLTGRETAEKMRNAARSFDRDVIVAVKMIMRNAFFRAAQKFLPTPERGPFPEGMPFPPPPPHGPMPPPPPPPPMPFGPEGPADPFFPPPPPPKGEEGAEDMGIFLPGDF